MTGMIKVDKVVNLDEMGDEDEVDGVGEDERRRRRRKDEMMKR